MTLMVPLSVTAPCDEPDVTQSDEMRQRDPSAGLRPRQPKMSPRMSHDQLALQSQGLADPLLSVGL